jgi:outer membrane protein
MSVAIVAALAAFSSELCAETMESALARAYRENPQLNAQRAFVRATDENVPQALSGYRPRVAVTASAGKEIATITQQTPLPNNRFFNTTTSQDLVPTAYGVTASQILFNGLQTANRTRTAESQVMGAREGLRVIEQTVLLNAASSYMDVLRANGNVEIQRSNVTALRQVMEQTNKRFSRGDVTQTDVSQTQTQLAAGELSLLQAEYAVAAARANYEAIIGIPPRNLAPATPVDRFSPRTLAAALQVGAAQNPNVTATMYGIDVAFLQVKVNEGSLFPSLVVQGTVQQAYQQAVLVPNQFVASVIGQLTIPIYQGGGEYSLIRQSKETLAQQRLNLDLIRLQTRANISQAWAQLEATKGEVKKAQAEVTAAEAAVNGILKEILVGERTTLDLLITQQNLVNARSALILAQHDRIVSSYALLAAVGGLSPAVLGLPTEVYDPQVHYRQVRDAWVGVRTPSGE